MPHANRPVYLFSVSNIGDLVLATATFDAPALCRAAALHVVTSATAAPLLGSDERLSGLHVIRSSHPVGWRAGVARALLAAARERAIVVNLEVYPPRWRFLRRATHTVGIECLELDLPGLIEDNRRSAAGQHVRYPHRAHYYSRAVRDAVDPPRMPKIVVTSEAREAVRPLVSHLPESGELSVVALSPGSTESSRRAPVHVVAAVAEELGRLHPIALLLLGVEAERAMCQEAAARVSSARRVENLAGRLPLPQLAAVLDACDLFIGNDSGPLKIAEAVGARTLSLWGPTGAAFAGPRGRGHVAVSFDTPPSESARMAATLLAAASRH